MTEHFEGDELETGTGKVRVVSYASFDALMDDQREYEEQANAQAHPDQVAIDWGDYAISKTEDEVTIWGQIMDYDSHIEFETEKATTQGEKDYIKRNIDEVHARGYRFGRWFSRLAPEGEWGTKHVSVLWKVSEEEFHAAYENKWEAPEQVRKAINARIAQALPDDPSVQAQIMREQVIEEIISDSAVIIYNELEDGSDVPDDFLRGVVTLGMYYTQTDPEEAERWLGAIRREMVKITLARKNSEEVSDLQ